jgi:hypothetical protein
MVSGPALSQIALETPTLPRSCRYPATRTVSISSRSPNIPVAAAARSPTPAEWPSSQGLFRSTRLPKVRATLASSFVSTPRTGFGSASSTAWYASISSRSPSSSSARSIIRSARLGSSSVPARRRTSATATSLFACEANMTAVKATCMSRAVGGIASPAVFGTPLPFHIANMCDSPA